MNPVISWHGAIRSKDGWYADFTVKCGPITTLGWARADGHEGGGPVTAELVHGTTMTAEFEREVVSQFRQEVLKMQR